MDFSLIWPHLICSRTLLNVGLCAVLIFTLLKMVGLIRSMVRWLYSVLGHRSQQFNNQSGQKASDESIVSQAPELESHNSEHVNSSCHSHPSVEVTQRNRYSTLFEGYSATSESWVQLQNEADDLIACIKEKLKERLPSLVTLNDTEVISLVDIVSGSILEIRKGHLRLERNGLNLLVNHDEENSPKEISTGVGM
ncbi:hypothetical protein BgiBS90_030641 [Biomphalaria glabrata]|nr:hypothetical protein BgiBS90_030641 [Biomphalaria glabrata]